MTTTTLTSGPGAVHAGLGSTMKTVDATGTVVNSYTYDIYGKKTSSSGSQANEFDFAGQQADPTGLQYLRARYYDPETGTFLSRDLMSAFPGWTGNPLGYAGANAVNRTDPTGLWCVGPLCADRDGVSVGGHEVAEGAKSVAAAGMGAIGAVKDAAWVAIRAAANSQLTGLALSAALGTGGSCSLGAALFWVCTGVSGIDALNKGGITFGNVYLLGEKFDPEKREPPSLRHEMKHADQWASAALSTPYAPLAGQGLMGAAYLANQGVTGSCGNVFEILAGLGDGGYTC